MTLCRLSVHPSVTSRSIVEKAERINLVFVHGLPSTFPALCWKEIRVYFFPLGLCTDSGLSIKNLPRHIAYRRKGCSSIDDRR